VSTTFNFNIIYYVYEFQTESTLTVDTVTLRENDGFYHIDATTKLSRGQRGGKRRPLPREQNYKYGKFLQ